VTGPVRIARGPLCQKGRDLPRGELGAERGPTACRWSPRDPPPPRTRPSNRMAGSVPKGDRMFFERSTGRRFRLRTTLAVMGLVGSSLALSVPARAVVDPNDPTPTENYAPKAGYVYDAPRPAGRLTPATGRLVRTHAAECST